MALRNVVDHPKFADLTMRLGVPRFMALGCLESLWHFAARFTPQGDIGKYTDTQIESWIGWNGDAGKLVQSLVDAHWLDPDPQHRLLVHDWADHADRATKQALGRKKLAFIVKSVITPCAQIAGNHESVRTESQEERTPCTQKAINGSPAGAGAGPVPEPVPEPEPGAVPEIPAVHTPLRVAECVQPDWQPEEEAIPDELPSPAMGAVILQLLSIPHSFGLAQKFASTVDLVARDEACARGEAARRLIERARGDPPRDGKWRFWLEDGRWKQRQEVGVSTEGWE